MEQRTPEWHEARKGLITASSVGAILGHSPNATRADVMRRMVREAHGAENEFNGNIATEYGTRNEDGALVEYRIETGHEVQTVGFITREDWAGCSPDGLIGDLGGMEIKCPFGKRKDEVPQFKTLADQPHYLDQVQFSIWVTGRAWWDFFQWAPNGTALERIVPDQQWRDTNLPILRQFHAEFLDTVNEPDEHLKPRRIVIDTPEASKLLREYDEMAEAEERANARRKAIIEELAMMAGQSNAELVGRKLTYVTREGAISYAKALAELAPGADLEKWRGKPSSSWRLG